MKSQPSIFNGVRTKDSSPLLIHQWYDNWFLPDYGDEQQISINGLIGSCWYMHQLLDDEIAKVGKENVVLWGARQSAAAALSSLLAWDGAPFAAVVGMSGWLPFDNLVWNYANGNDEDCHGDEFWAPDTYWPKEHVDDEDFD
jgi:hypothetical protein